MSLAARFPVIALVLLVAFVASCTRQPPAERAAALAVELAEIRDQMPADPTAEQADALTKPAKRADKAYTQLLKLQKTNPQDPAVAEARAQAEPVYAEVRRRRRLASERQRVAELMGGLKVRAYRATRTVVVPKLLDTLATAARQAATTDLDQLPKLVREAAELAASLADVLPTGADAKPPALTRSDWQQVATRIDSWNAAEPAEFPLGLALGYAVLGQTGFALVELDRVDPAKLSEPEYAALVPLTRAIVLSRLGCLELATREAAGDSGGSERGQQTLAALHALLAYGYATEKDWQRMDRELAHAVRIWPNNPLVVFLSGERLLADGRKEQALETLTRAAAGSEAAWLAPLVEKRIRQVRDSNGAAPPLLLDHELIAKCVLHSLIEQAQRSELGRKFAHFLEASQLLPSAVIGQPGEERTNGAARATDG